MSSYTSVKTELDRGTPPELLCATCPWDRLCIAPPPMTAAQITRAIKDAADPTKGLAGDDKQAQLAMAVITAAQLTGRDTQAEVCPVFALRLTGPDGRGIADGIREQMRGWKPGDDPQATPEPTDAN